MVSLLDIHNAYYGQLPHKTRYYLHDHYRPHHGLKLDHIKVTYFFLKLTADQVLVFDWITGSLVVIRAGLFRSQLTLTQNYQNIIIES